LDINTLLASIKALKEGVDVTVKHAVLQRACVEELLLLLMPPIPCPLQSHVSPPDHIRDNAYV
jgi:hypothetical protein